MFCSKCGNQMPDGSLFCPKCGNQLKEAVEGVSNNVNGENEYDAATTMKCPHCGGVMYKMLDTCPHCRGPVMSDELREEKENYEKRMVEEREFYEKINKDENIHFWVATIVGIISFVFFLWLVIGDMTSGSDFDWGIFPSAVLLAGVVYGIHVLHPIRRFGVLLAIPILGWALFIWLIGAFAILLGWIFYLWAMLCKILKKPILSEKRIDRLIEKGLIDY